MNNNNLWVIRIVFFVTDKEVPKFRSANTIVKNGYMVSGQQNQVRVFVFENLHSIQHIPTDYFI